MMGVVGRGTGCVKTEIPVFAAAAFPLFLFLRINIFR
jgi:hypothetical protein